MNLQELSRLTIAELLAAYRAGVTDPVEVADLTFAQIEAVNGRINALYDLRRDAAMAEAEASARRWKAGRPEGALDGAPVTLKDSVHAVGMTWHHGSAAHGAGVKGAKDAPPTEKLKAARAIIIGKCTMPDYGLSASGVSSFHGIVRNPFGLAWNTGGSSAGAGASLAAGIGMMSVGSDIAGSVRLPASHCGLAALKPTQGMIPHTPGSDVRSAGPMARYAADLEPLLRVLGGVHPDDRYSVPVTEPAAETAAPGAGLTVAVYDAFGFGPAVEPAVLEALARARDAIAGLVERVVAPDRRIGWDAYLPLDEALQWRGWREYAAAVADRRDETPRQLVDWFSPARDWTAERIAGIDAGIARAVAEAGALFEGADVLLTPVMPIVNFPAEDRGIDPAMPLRHCTFTALFNQSGHPAVSICGGFDDRGLPVGVQLVGRRFDDVRLVRLAAALEAALWPGGRAAAGWPLAPRGQSEGKGGERR
ncbi:MAG: hypothetical protein KDJ78_00720 [Rhodobacteraceae bacterium]|uniref:amidase n=1 Tax=Amaricoccus sp. TaxID=1872485 RepID=UPI001D8DD234|nr:amidase family protein [Amaricoccus sp.]MCB1372700.1 hypothetical protein [Paracoccaceae bacterium]MCB1402518.1 hypothetical protein [Paracoccaceae bacterium]MCC0067468.1 amidase [Rhodovulum sp.]HRW16572.1 amidase family protein [Amaricoccus sp.]